MNIFIGNLAFEAKEQDVGSAFANFGKVDSVVIVMDKNGKKSRGFGFIEMPDEKEAQAAIAALQGREILGRPVNVMPALPKKQKSEHKDKKSDSKKELVYKRTGKYKEGRRTFSYMKRRMAAGITAPVAERKFKANPMRWRKKSRWATPYQKPEGESKPWKKAEGASKPWIKRESSQSRPWKKTEGESKPWKKTEGTSKPWVKRESSESRPWKKTEGASKPWRKSSGSSQSLRPKRAGGFVKHKR